jgi:molybdate transport system ATP-binding protein
MVMRQDALNHLTWVQIADIELAIPRLGLPIGSSTRIQIDARDVSIALTQAQDSSILNLLPTTITALLPDDHPAYYMVKLDLGGVPFLARITTFSAKRLQLCPGLTVFAQIKSVSLAD